MRVLLFTKAQLEARVSAKRLKRICDDNSDGDADDDPVALVRRDASSKVMSYVKPLGIAPQIEALFATNGELVDANSGPDEELVRLALNVAVAMLCQRHPEVMRLDWQKLMDDADKELDKLRKGVTSLALSTAPAVANAGATVVTESGSSTVTECPPPPRIFDDMGDF